MYPGSSVSSSHASPKGRPRTGNGTRHARRRSSGGEPLLELRDGPDWIGANRANVEEGDARLAVRGDPLAHVRRRSDQRRGGKELGGDGGGSGGALAVQVQVLDLGGFRRVAIALKEIVVEVPASRA